jgi:hypothetical protein
MSFADKACPVVFRDPSMAVRVPACTANDPRAYARTALARVNVKRDDYW